MTKFRFSKAMFVVLVIAFLSMQWSSAHIHLAEHHEHGGSHHQHDIEAHAHQSITLDDNSSSFTPGADNHNVNIVELDHQCNTKSGNHLDEKYISSNSADFYLSSIPPKSSIEPTEVNNSKLQYIEYSTIYGRAPPKAS